MDINLFRGLLTLILFVLFAGLLFWSYSKKRRHEFDAAAQLPLENDSSPPSERTKESQR
ncbi:MAG: cbb3-type cytochrome c oxidase subunit 3 [Pseudomonadota bacterium]